MCSDVYETGLSDLIVGKSASLAMLDFLQSIEPSHITISLFFSFPLHGFCYVFFFFSGQMQLLQTMQLI